MVVQISGVVKVIGNFLYDPELVLNQQCHTAIHIDVLFITVSNTEYVKRL